MGARIPASSAGAAGALGPQGQAGSRGPRCGRHGQCGRRERGPAAGLARGKHLRPKRRRSFVSRRSVGRRSGGGGARLPRRPRRRRCRLHGRRRCGGGGWRCGWRSSCRESDGGGGRREGWPLLIRDPAPAAAAADSPRFAVAAGCRGCKRAGCCGLADGSRSPPATRGARTAVTLRLRQPTAPNRGTLAPGAAARPLLHPFRHPAPGGPPLGGGR